MPYLTVRQSPKFAQLSFDDVLNDTVNLKSLFYGDNTINTRTIYQRWINPKMRDKVNVWPLIRTLKAFVASHENLYEEDRESLYHTFYIPKKSGGLRQIDEPCPELMGALRDLKTIFENEFGVLYHTSAFAYVKRRCAVDAVKRHQYNKSNWFAKFDFSDFFGSITEDFCYKMVAESFPFCLIVEYPDGEEILRKTLNLCFLKGGLPQGTPISPLLTNLIMIPVDYYLYNYLRKDERKFVYTRYADDILISARESFKTNEIEDLIHKVLDGFGAPIKLNPKKTRYGSRAGRNWNLGVMLNKDNEITIGYKKKDRFKAMCSNYINDKKNDINWDLHDVQVFAGLISYYKSIEPQNIEEIIDRNNKKYRVDMMRLIKADLTV